MRRAPVRALPLGAGRRAARRQPGPGPAGRGDRRRGRATSSRWPTRTSRSTPGAAPTPRWSTASRPAPGTRVFPLQTNYRSTPRGGRAGPGDAPGGKPLRQAPARPAGRRRARAPVVAHLASVQDEAAVRRAAHRRPHHRRARPGRASPSSTAPTTTRSTSSSRWPQAGVEFELFSGARFVESAHVKDVLAFCRLRHNPRDELAWHRALRLFERVGEAVAARALARDRRPRPTRWPPPRPSTPPARRRAPGCAASPRRSARLAGIDAPGGDRAAGRPRRLVPRPPPARVPQLARPRGRPGPPGRARGPRDDLERFLADLQLAERVEADEDVSGPAAPGGALDGPPGQGPRVAGGVRAPGGGRAPSPRAGRSARATSPRRSASSTSPSRGRPTSSTSAGRSPPAGPGTPGPTRS